MYGCINYTDIVVGSMSVSIKTSSQKIIWYTASIIALMKKLSILKF